MTSHRLVAIRAVLATASAAVFSVVVARAYGERDRERIAKQSDGYGDPDGDTITQVMQVLIGTGLFVGLCATALALELLLWRRRRARAG